MESADEGYVRFALHSGRKNGKQVSIVFQEPRLKPGLLPEEFTMLARKAFGGIAAPQELIRWKNYKEKLGPLIMSMKPETLLDIDGPYEAFGTALPAEESP